MVSYNNSYIKAFILNFSASSTNGKTVRFGISLKPFQEKAIPCFFAMVGSIAHIKEYLLVGTKKFVYDCKYCFFNFRVIGYMCFFYLTDNELIGLTTSQYDIFLIETDTVVYISIC